MSEAHTPGPWFSEHRKKRSGMWDTEVFCAKGETIATIAWYPMPTVDGVTGTYREGNARLIAAAPDMLAVLQQISFLLSATPEDQGEPSFMPAVRVAISRATQS